MTGTSIAEDILQAALAEAATHEAKHIRAIHIQIGAPNFEREAELESCLKSILHGTTAEGAQLEIDIVGATFKCPKCGLTSKIGRHWPRCPGCGYRNLRALDDRVLFSVKVDVD